MPFHETSKSTIIQHLKRILQSKYQMEYLSQKGREVFAVCENYLSPIFLVVRQTLTEKINKTTEERDL